jgi:hypothetical protein
LRRTDRRGGQLGAHRGFHSMQLRPAWAAGSDRFARA